MHEDSLAWSALNRTLVIFLTLPLIFINIYPEEKNIAVMIHFKMSA